MRPFLWRLLARVLSTDLVTNLLIKQATKTPYHHLGSPDGSELYMARYWLWNPYDRQTHAIRHRWCPFSIRLHFIHREDLDRHMHDHPWDARTIILRGGYVEQIPAAPETVEAMLAKLRREGVPEADMALYSTASMCEYVDRQRGYTGALLHGQYHRIDKILGECAVTVFITWPYKGPWGFLVAGKKVPWKKYLGIPEDQDLQSAPLPCDHEYDFDEHDYIRCVYCGDEPGRDECPKSSTGLHEPIGGMVQQPDGALRMEHTCMLCRKEL